ncbi:hypothetical protein KAH81_02020 [bacterium]|nr:hypothetical protein [bacterium]
MITIFSGDIDSGKTTAMAEYYVAHGGDGFLSIKVFEDGDFIGYDLKRLSTGEKTPFARLAESAQQFGDYIYGRFRFSIKAFESAKKTLSWIIEKDKTPIYLDEIGPIELAGGGWDKIIRVLIDSGIDIIMAIRRDCIESVIDKYLLKNVRIEYLPMEENNDRFNNR